MILVVCASRSFAVDWLDAAGLPARGVVTIATSARQLRGIRPKAILDLGLCGRTFPAGEHGEIAALIDIFRADGADYVEVRT